MDNTNNKVITVSLMVGALLLGLTVSVLLDTLAAVSTGAFGRFLGQDLVRHGLPVVVGLVFFFGLQFNKRVTSWANDVVAEIRRIVWPSRKDTFAMTVVVCVMLLISGMVLGLMDLISARAIDSLLNFSFMGIFS